VQHVELEAGGVGLGAIVIGSSYVRIANLADIGELKNRGRIFQLKLLRVVDCLVWRFGSCDKGKSIEIVMSKVLRLG